LAKALELVCHIPPHKWDSNELFDHCYWLQPTDKEINKNAALAKLNNVPVATGSPTTYFLV
jgi:hypothetical protein